MLTSLAIIILVLNLIVFFDKWTIWFFHSVRDFSDVYKTRFVSDRGAFFVRSGHLGLAVCINNPLPDQTTALKLVPQVLEIVL